MTVQPPPSDESEETPSPPPRDRAYRRKYQLLLERCDVLRQDNERILNRIRRARDATRRYKRDVKVLAARLDAHEDAYRSERSADPRKCPRRRHKPPEPRAPKKPCNAFFQFCVSQRAGGAGGAGGAGVQSAGAQSGGGQSESGRLAARWRDMSAEDKRVYVDMYHRSRQHYRRQMSEYATHTTHTAHGTQPARTGHAAHTDDD